MQTSNSEAAADYLRDAIMAIPAEFYDSVGMRKVQSPPFTGRAFFPIGRGFVGTSFPRDGIMMVGSEWGTEGDLQRLATREEKESDPTWARALDLLSSADPDRRLGLKEKAWFTNFAMGVRAGFGSNSKDISPWFKPNEPRPNDFVLRCKEIFEMQLALQRPRAVVIFGKPVAITLGRLYPGALGSWNRNTFPERDIDDGAASSKVMLGSYVAPLIVSIVHPSKWRLNVVHRRFRELEGAAAEAALLQLVASQFQ
jgi:hypothetical protein